MDSVAAIVLFDLAFVAPPLAVIAGLVMLVLPSRRKGAEAPGCATTRAA